MTEVREVYVNEECTLELFPERTLGVPANTYCICYLLLCNKLLQTVIT